jgi:hypothetical protein
MTFQEKTKATDAEPDVPGEHIQATIHYDEANQ